MSLFDVLGIFLIIISLFSYINERFIHLPQSIGVTIMALVTSVFLIFYGDSDSIVKAELQSLLTSINFKDALMRVMLSFLLFAGAIHLNLKDLIKVKWPVCVLATVSTVLSAFLIAGFIYFLLPLFGTQIDFLYCLIFGAVISPTDPIAVLAMLKDSKAPPLLRMKVAGESLFNDGVGVVLFTVFVGLVTSHESHYLSSALVLFVREAIGGILYGALIGWISIKLLKKVQNHHVQILITLAVVTGGYNLAHWAEISGPLAMVVAGLFFSTQHNTDEGKRSNPLPEFWGIIDEVLNISLFVLIGLEILLVNVTERAFLEGLVMIPLVLIARYVTVWLPVKCLNFRFLDSPNTVKILTWGGLRGGLAIAMALSVPETVPETVRVSILCITYVVVLFSVIVQGLTFRRIKF